MPRHLRYWVGLDAGHLETAVCLVDAEGHVFFEAMTETRAAPIRDILRRFGVEAVQSITIEAGVGTQMVRDLCSFGFPVQVVDVRKSSKFLAIRRQKTDANDAKGLADPYAPKLEILERDILPRFCEAMLEAVSRMSLPQLPPVE